MTQIHFKAADEPDIEKMLSSCADDAVSGGVMERSGERHLTVALSTLLAAVSMSLSLQSRVAL